ncbi:MAG: signal peptidase I [Oscillospiraceae bacterium]|nr:signal peptidase I [Oscillospiraceae bacterium]
MKRQKIIIGILGWVRTLALTFICVLVIQNVLIVHAVVISPSMESTVMTGSRIIGSRITYRFCEPERFDIILFQAPDGETEIPYLKRIIGLPNETVEIKNGKVYINDSGIPLEDSFIQEAARGNYGPFTVPENSYFVLGDNRNNSHDSKNWRNKYVPRENILGKVYISYYPTPKYLNKP